MPPSPCPNVCTEPFGLTVPLTPWPITRPEVTTVAPPEVPDCAKADGAARASRSEARANLRLAVFDMSQKSIIVKNQRQNQRPEPSAQTLPIMRQALPALPHSSSAASFARCTLSRWTSDHDLSEIANAPQLLP